MGQAIDISIVTSLNGYYSLLPNKVTTLGMLFLSVEKPIEVAVFSDYLSLFIWKKALGFDLVSLHPRHT